MDEDEVLEVDVSDLMCQTMVDAMEELKNYNIGSEGRKQLYDYLISANKIRVEENKAGDELLKLELERERLEVEKEAQARDQEFREKQLNSDKKKILVEVGKSLAFVAAWFGMNILVMRFEEHGTIRSKAFAGTIPKTKI